MNSDEQVFNFELPFVMMLAGHTGSGKSTLMQKILKQVWTQFEFVFIMSRTLYLNDDFIEFPENANPNYLPIVKHYGDNFETHTQTIIDLMGELVSNDREDAPSILIVYEDQANTKLTKNGGLLDRFVLLIRHYKISMMFSTQRITGIARTVRINTKYFILFPQSNFSELERFLEELIPIKYRHLLREHVGQIFFQKYVFIIVDAFNPILTDRLWILGKVNAIDYLEMIDHQETEEFTVQQEEEE